ncbi:hypothetical protein JTB14_002619 [Gonioctena quinquepunctata]|nr:hypothetical protein JTB14_002619 [Gonioctena quinquepunctata]
MKFSEKTEKSIEEFSDFIPEGMSNSLESEKRLETPIFYIDMKPIEENDTEIGDGVQDAEENVNIHENPEIQEIPEEIHDDSFEARRGLEIQKEINERNERNSLNEGESIGREIKENKSVQIPEIQKITILIL